MPISFKESYLGKLTPLLKGLTTIREDKKSYTDEDIRIICILTNTADYCWTTIAQLEEKLIEKIKEEYKAQVQMTDERDVFVRYLLSLLEQCLIYSVASAGIKLLVKTCEVNIDPHLVTMTKLPWISWENVGDQNTYVTSIGTYLMNIATLVQKVTGGNKYYKMFCEKFAESFLARFYANVFKCRVISPIGAEQVRSF